jgi:hypothetical protein
MSITPENIIYLNNFYTDYYLTRIEINNNVIKMSRVKKIYKYELSTRKLEIRNSNLNEALIRYKLYNFDYEIQRREKIYKQRDKVEKGLMVAFIIGAVVICL